VYETFWQMITTHLEAGPASSFRPDAIDAWTIERLWGYIWSDREIRDPDCNLTHFQ
jgi:hypothetical protein